jgi:hypothetical protein
MAKDSPKQETPYERFQRLAQKLVRVPKDRIPKSKDGKPQS